MKYISKLVMSFFDIYVFYSGLYPPPELLCNSTATTQIGFVELTRGRVRGAGGCARVRIRLGRAIKPWEDTPVAIDCRAPFG